MKEGKYYCCYAPFNDDAEYVEVSEGQYYGAYYMLGLAPDGELQINQSSVLPKSYKPYYNILLDDRAGLEESYEILKYVVDEIIKLN